MDILKTILNTLIPLLRYGGIILAAFYCITKRRDKLAVIGIGLAAASWLVPVVQYSNSPELLVQLVAWGLMVLISYLQLTEVCPPLVDFFCRRNKNAFSCCSLKEWN